MTKSTAGCSRIVNNQYDDFRVNKLGKFTNRRIPLSVAKAM